MRRKTSRGQQQAIFGQSSGQEEHQTEIPFMRATMLALGAGHGVRIHRQNCGQIMVRNREGEVIRAVDFGPPTGAADVSGWVIPEGWRIELEFKAAGKKRNYDQERWARAVIGGGCVYLLLEYNDSLDMSQNVARAVAMVEAAIAERRARK